MSRLAGVLVVVALSLVGYPAAVITDLAIHRLPDGAPPGFLHVAHPHGETPYIADDLGRRVLLHGAIPAGLVDYWSGTDPNALTPPPHYPVDPAAYAGGACPANSAVIRTPPLCEVDIRQMKALGFNSIRLPISWSLLEPARGQIDGQYLERVAQVVAWARAQQIWVIIDMHQNAYSRYTGRPASMPLPDGRMPALWDHSGAPAWATITDGLPAEDYLGQRGIDPAVLEADTNFWDNRDGIQDEYIAAFAAVVRRFRDEPAVAGYGVFNEPWPGWSLPPAFDDLLLFPFYRRVLDAVTGAQDGLRCPAGAFHPVFCGQRDLGVRSHQLFFLEPALDRVITDFPTHLGLPGSSYPNLVLAIHAYTHKYTLDALAGQDPAHATYPPGGYDLSYSTAEREARVLGAALFVSEFGDEVKEDPLLVTNQLREQERHLTGWAFWTWKESCGNGWGVFAPVVSDGCAYEQPAGRKDVSPKPQSGCLRAGRERLLARVYPEAAPDGYTYSYDPQNGAFTMAGRGDPSGVDLVIPSEVTGVRAVNSLPGGRYRISIAPAPLRLIGC